MGRFIPNENTWIGFALTLTGTKAAPKVADVTGAVNLTHFVTSLNATAQGNSVPTPAFDTLFETSVVGTSQGTFTADCYRDDTTDTAEKSGPRGHVYDHQGNRVTCLPSNSHPLEHRCFCGHVTTAARSPFC